MSFSTVQNKVASNKTKIRRGSKYVHLCTVEKDSLFAYGWIRSFL
jgi:hypothetical protein